MTLENAKAELEKFVKLKTTMRPTFVQQLLDAVEVVRCRDCYYCFTEKSFDKEYLYCDAFCEHAEGDLIGVSLMVEPNHYCPHCGVKMDEVATDGE